MEHHPVNFLEKDPITEQPKPSRRRRVFLLSCIILGVLLSIICVRAITSVPQPNEPDAYDPITLEPKTPQGLLQRIEKFVFRNDATKINEKDDRINILLLGMGGAGHDGAYLTDTMMIASIKPSTGQIALISIPRDLSVYISGYGWRKINAVNAFAEAKEKDSGGPATVKLVDDIFKIKLDYYVRLDFAAFEKIINDVEGITVNVDRSFTDQQYPTEDLGYQTVSFKQGETKMNGERALIYARSRHGNNNEGSDFARAHRQQLMLLALKEKVLSFGTLTNPIKVHKIYTDLNEHINTDMQFGDMMSFLKLAKSLNTDHIIPLVFDSSPGGFLKVGTSSEGAFILEPVSGNFDTMASAVENIFNDAESTKMNVAPQEAPTLPSSTVEMQNGTWRAGLAARLRERLQNKQISVTTVGNTANRPQTESGVYKVKDTAANDTLVALEQELAIPIKQNPPAGITPSSSTEILVVIGEDFQE